MSLPSLQTPAIASAPGPIPSQSAPALSGGQSFAGSLQKAMLAPQMDMGAKNAPSAPPAPKAPQAKPAERQAPSSSEGSPAPQADATAPENAQAPASQPPSVDPAAEPVKSDKDKDQSGQLSVNGLNPNLAFLLAQPALSKPAEAKADGGGSVSKKLGKAEPVGLEGLDEKGGAKKAQEGSIDVSSLKSTEVSPESANAFKQALLSAQDQQKDAAGQDAKAGASAASDPSSAAALALAAASKSEGSNFAAAPARASAPLPLAQGSDAFATGAASVMTRMSASGETKALVQVSPEALGPIKIEISMSGDASKAMSVSFSAADDRTTALLQDHLNRLSDTLGSMGWQLKEVKATTDSNLGQQSSQQNFSGSSFDGSGQRQGFERDQRANERQDQSFGKLVEGGWTDRTSEFAERAKNRDSRSNFDFYA